MALETILLRSFYYNKLNIWIGVLLNACCELHAVFYVLFLACESIGQVVDVVSLFSRKTINFTQPFS